MAGPSSKNLLLGFVAGAIAVVTVHEIINLVLLQLGIFSRVPWSMEPAAVTSVPKIVSDIFWGGLWGEPAILLQFIGQPLGAPRAVIF